MDYVDSVGMIERYIKKSDLLKVFDEEFERRRQQKNPVTWRTMYRVLRKAADDLPVTRIEDDRWVVQHKGWW